MIIKKLASVFVLFCFILTSLNIPQVKAAEGVINLPQPGTMVNLSPGFEPALIKGLTVHKDNPFLFDFILDTGNDMSIGPIASNAQGGVIASAAKRSLKQVGDRLVKYFFACLTIPEKDLWVNLSPYEKQRMIPNALGQTALGRDLLAEDYILKQLTASLIYPEKNLGKEFWNRVYAKAQAEYGTTQIPVNTFNKVWILADHADVYENGQTAFVLDGHLKVMLDEDYLALSKHQGQPGDMTSVVSPSTLPSDLALNVKASQGNNRPTNTIASQIIRQIVLPEIEHEVNYGKNFAPLRQIYNSLILASWYKKNLKQALLNQVYADKSTVKGIERGVKRPNGGGASAGVIASAGKQSLQDLSPEQIYQQYLKAYRKGVFNYIKEDMMPDGQTIPKKYFSGGFGVAPSYLHDINRSSSKGAAMISQAMSSFGKTGGVLSLTVALELNDINPAMQAVTSHQPVSQAMLTNEQRIIAKVLQDFLKSYHISYYYINSVRSNDGQKPVVVDGHAMTINIGKHPSPAYIVEAFVEKLEDNDYFDAYSKDALQKIWVNLSEKMHSELQVHGIWTDEEYLQLGWFKRALTALLFNHAMVAIGISKRPRDNVFVDSNTGVIVPSMKIHMPMIYHTIQLSMESKRLYSRLSDLLTETQYKESGLLASPRPQGTDIAPYVQALEKRLSGLLSKKNFFTKNVRTHLVEFSRVNGTKNGATVQAIVEFYFSNMDLYNHVIIQPLLVNDPIRPVPDREQWVFLLKTVFEYAGIGQESHAMTVKLKNGLKLPWEDVRRIMITLQEMLQPTIEEAKQWKTKGQGTYQERIKDLNLLRSLWSEDHPVSNGKRAKDVEAFKKILDFYHIDWMWGDSSISPYVRDIVRDTLRTSANHLMWLVAPDANDELVIEHFRQHNYFSVFETPMFQDRGYYPVVELLTQRLHGVENIPSANLTLEDYQAMEHLVLYMDHFYPGNSPENIAKAIKEALNAMEKRVGGYPTSFTYYAAGARMGSDDFIYLIAGLLEGTNTIYPNLNEYNANLWAQLVEGLRRRSMKNNSEIKELSEKGRQLSSNFSKAMTGVQLAARVFVGSVVTSLIAWQSLYHLHPLQRPPVPPSSLRFISPNFHIYTNAADVKANGEMLPPAPPVGGIDLNSANMAMTVTKDAHGGVQVNFNPALIAQIRAKGIWSAKPFIISIQSMDPAQIKPLLGVGQ